MQHTLEMQTGTPSSPPAPSDRDLAHAFRAAMRRMAATVTIVSTEHRGVRHGMTATAVTSVSLEPPSLLVCINHEASIHEPLCQSGRFCISILAAGHDEHCHTFSGRKEGEARFDAGDWRSDDGVPYLADAQANLFCTVARRVSYGTHTVFVARVTHVRVDDRRTPLVYVDGALADGLVQAG